MKNDESFIPLCAKQQKCNICNEQSARKVEEVLFDDDPTAWQDNPLLLFSKIPMRHPYTAYVCLSCFNKIMGIKKGFKND